MAKDPWYNEGSRELQERFDTGGQAERLEERSRAVFTDGDREFIEARNFFFLATADQHGGPDCSYRGGEPGFVRVVGEGGLIFPDYDGNGMFRSLGNLKVNPRVGLLFMDFQRPRRLRVNGAAMVHSEDPLMGEFPGAQLIIRIQAERIFSNCSRFIPKMEPVGE